MSSHHFVREGQEPALCIAQALSFEQAQPLLEWSPMVIVLEGAVNDVLLWGIKIDAVVCTEARKHFWAEKLLEQSPVKLIGAPTEDDFLPTAIAWLVERGQTAVHVMTASPLAFAWGGDVAMLQVIVLDGALKWSACRGTFSKWMPQGARLYLRPAKGTLQEVNGLVAVGDFWEVAAEGMVGFRATGTVWVGEPL